MSTHTFFSLWVPSPVATVCGWTDGIWAAVSKTWRWKRNCCAGQKHSTCACSDWPWAGAKRSSELGRWKSMRFEGARYVFSQMVNKVTLCFGCSCFSCLLQWFGLRFSGGSTNGSRAHGRVMSICDFKLHSLTPTLERFEWTVTNCRWIQTTWDKTWLNRNKRKVWFQMAPMPFTMLWWKWVAMSGWQNWVLNRDITCTQCTHKSVGILWQQMSWASSAVCRQDSRTVAMLLDRMPMQE